MVVRAWVAFDREGELGEVAVTDHAK